MSVLAAILSTGPATSPPPSEAGRASEAATILDSMPPAAASDAASALAAEYGCDIPLLNSEQKSQSAADFAAYLQRNSTCSKPVPGASGPRQGLGDVRSSDYQAQGLSMCRTELVCCYSAGGRLVCPPMGTQFWPAAIGCWYVGTISPGGSALYYTTTCFLNGSWTIYF